jgi:hypothetical protein
MLNYLAKNKLTALLALTAYFLALVYFHDAATVAADWFKYKITMTYYNPVLLIGGLSLSMLMAWFIFRTVRNKPERWIFLILFLITTLFMVLALFTLMVVNMEAIHFPQYAILAILVFPLVRRYDTTYVLTSILGIVDEIYQYLVLNPTFMYLDFNDFVLNMLGAGAGLLIIAAFRFPEIKTLKKWYKSSSFYFIFVLILLGICLSLQQFITFFPVPENFNGTHWFSIYRDHLPDQFWTFLYGRRYYHILRPWEGITVMILLTLLYARIGYIYHGITVKKSANL